MLSELPRFNAARRFGLPLFSFGVGLGLIALVFIENASGQSGLWRAIGTPLPPAVGVIAAAFLVAAAGFLSAGTMSYARQRSVSAAQEERMRSIASARQPSATAKTSRKWQSALHSLMARASEVWNEEKLTEWPLALIPILFGALAAYMVVMQWRAPLQETPSPFVLKMLGGGLLMLAFPLLVLQRTYANYSADLLPEAPQLERLVRVPLAVCVGVAIALALLSAGFPWAIRIERIVAVIVFVVAIELILRGFVTVFVPFAAIEQRQSIADSSIAGFLLRLKPPTLRTINVAVRRQFGVDLSRSWALAFVQRAALPVMAGIGVFAWLVTGITALPLNQRGVYQRFGVPVAVFAPGLHLHLPWPIGIVTTTEIGVVHQLPIEFVLPNGNGQVVPEEKEITVNAEAIPPPSADRLWDDAHPFEGSYLIASQENGQQSFQLVDVDMAVVYQVGLSDEAARNAAYRVTDPEQLIQALSGQILVRYLSHNQLLDLLGQSRENFAGEFQKALQEQLDRFNTGLEVLAISIEAIQPPPDAAAAYHDVQAAEIRAGIRVAESKGDAARSQKLSEMQATGYTNDATAAAAELVNQAQAASVLFGGDRRAYARGGNAFLLERWFDNLRTALPNSEFIIVDHRLSAQDVPTLDLRSTNTPTRFDSPLAPSAAPPAAAPPAAGQQTQPNGASPRGDDEDD